MLLREEEITERKRLLRVRHSFGHGRYHDDTVHSFFFHPPIVVVDVPFCLWPVFFSFSFRPSWHSCNTFATLCSSARFGPSGPLCLLFPSLTSALIFSECLAHLDLSPSSSYPIVLDPIKLLSWLYVRVR